MNSTRLWALLLSLLIGVFIEIFFRLVKYRDALNKIGPQPVTEYIGSSNYTTVSEYLSGGERKWFHYFLFRLLPPAILLLLLAGSLQERDPADGGT